MSSLDIRTIRENPDLYRTACKNKKVHADIDRILALDKQIRPRKAQIEELQASRNRIAQQMRNASTEERKTLQKDGLAVKKSIEQESSIYRQMQEELLRLLQTVPLVPCSDVPIGKSDADNVEIKKWGEVPRFTFKQRDHVELGRINDLLDIERGVKIAGSRSYVLRGKGVELENAVMQYVLRTLSQKGFIPFSVPVLVRQQTLVGSGHFPIGEEQTYRLEKDDLALVGTSEVPLVAYHQGEVLASQDLPLRYMALSSCFRREAGTYGKDTHGLFRVHQFQKVEQLIIGRADKEDSASLHAELLANSEEILQALELPYRVVYVCTGDLGIGQYRKHDVETWMPSRNTYGETHSCSTLLDFQASRLQIRYRDTDGKKKFCYTLNNTAVASPRIIIPLLECHQTEDGKIKIPHCLQSYIGREIL